MQKVISPTSLDADQVLQINPKQLIIGIFQTSTQLFA